MTPEAFRRAALSLPDATEASHMDHPDFRVANKIFATIPEVGRPRGMVKLTPEQQADFIAAEPDTFEPAQGAWGRQGCTYVNLKLIKPGTLKHALSMAWRNTAPKRLLEDFEATVERASRPFESGTGVPPV